MNEENVKLARIKKSSKVAHAVSKTLFIVSMVACVITLVTGLVLFFGRDKFDPQIKEALAANPEKANATIGFGNIKVATVEDGNFVLDEAMRWTSDVPALETFFRNNDDSPAFTLGLYLMFISLLIAFVTFCLYLISSVFALLHKEGNPFDKKVIKRIMVTMIILSAILLTTSGMGLGILCGLLTWVVYTILDYGRLLKTQSDETL